MGKRPLIIIKSADLDFMSEYMKKHNIKKYDIKDTPLPYEEYDADARFIEKVSENVSTEMAVKYRFKNLSDNGSFKRCSIYAKFFVNEKEMHSINTTFSWKIVTTYEELLKVDKHKNEIEGLVAMWKVLGTDEEELQKIKDKYAASLLPLLDVKIDECSKDITKEENMKQAKEAVILVFELHAQISMFLAYFKPEVTRYATRNKERVSIAAASKKSPAKKKKKKQANAGILTIIPMEKFVQDVQSGNLKLPRRKCPYAFQVRGHWREYKSGKRVWIKEFTKGDTTKKKKKQVVVLGKRKDEKE